jgi:uncharacterized protein
MELYTIALQSQNDSEAKFIIFRPLLGIAFIGNANMANLTREILLDSHEQESNQNDSNVVRFLDKIGFLKEDPSPPKLPNNGNFYPTHTVLLLTNRCQMRCVYCYASGGELPPEDLSFDTAKTTIDIVHQNAVSQNEAFFTISFHGGGEPMVAWELIRQCAHYARKKTLPVKLSLTSNGVWTAQQRTWVIKNIDRISLSMDGPPDIQNHNRPLANGGPSSPILERTIKALDENHKTYGIRMTAVPPYSDLPRSVAFLISQTQCRGVQVEPAFNTERGEHTEPDLEEAHQFITAFLKAYDLSREYKRDLRYSAARVTHPVRTFCTAPYNTLIVNPQNEIVACYEITNPDHQLASLSKCGTIDLTGLHTDEKKRQNLISLIEDKRVSCRDCFCYWSCAGDCYARTIIRKEDGNYINQNARCVINQTLTIELLLRKIAENDGVAHLFNTKRQRHE